MKGVSPLIAAVLLIVFTILIAGILANFATTLSRQQLSQAGEAAECIGALDVDSLRVAGNDISFRIRNIAATNITLTGITAAVDFSNIAENEVFDSGDDADLASLAIGATKFITLDITGKTSNPLRIEVVASNCLRSPAVLSF